MATNAGTRERSVLKEGFLLKRQRGLSMNTDLRKLKFQQRFIQLSQTKLKYFTGKDRRNLRGSYSVKEITIVEKVPDVTFGKYFCFQIGNEREVMYFGSKSEKERDAWIETFRIAANLNANTMLSHYHTGAYGQVDLSKWSCCGATKRESTGCQRPRSARHRDRASTIATSSKDHDQEMTSSSEFVSQSLPGGHFCQEENGYDESATEDVYSQTAESPAEVDSHTKNLGRLYKIDAQSVKSVDSGLGMQANKRHESVASLGVGEDGLSLSGLSPQSYRKRIQKKQNSIEFPEPNSENWTLLRGIDMDKSASLIKAVFRDADMLVSAYMDGKHCIQIATANVTKPEEDGNVYMTAKSVGSIDTWRKYLAVGFPKLQLVDTNDWTWNKTLLNGEKPHHCAFKPDGSLVTAAYDSHVIDIWPHVESLRADSSVDNVEIKRAAQIYIKDTTHIISSLSVSPNRNEPWLAVGLRMTENGSHHVYICDYNQNQQKWQQQLDDSEKYAHRDSECGTDVHTAFSHDGRQLAVGCGSYLKVFDLKGQNLIYDYPFSDAFITSLSYSPTSDYLSIGLNSGQVKVFGEPLTTAFKKPFTLPMPETPAAAVTSMTYSRDCQTLAVGHSDGALNLWNVPKIASGIETDFVRTGALDVDSTGVVHVLEDDAITISIPQGAIPQNASRTLKYGVLPHGPFGPFKFQDGVRPVSAILSICPEPDVGFLEPIDLTIPIFVDCEEEVDCQRLAIFKACIAESTTDDEGVYKMDEVADGELTLFTDRKSRIQFVKVSVKHCCCYCVGEYFRKDTNKAKFCLVEAVPKTQLLGSPSEWTIDYCLPYYLHTCIKTIEEQYPESAYKLTMRAVRFSDDNDCNDPAIHIKFQENLDAGWKIMLKDGRDKIHRKDVYFWDMPSRKELGCMCEKKTYPPRFTVIVDGRRATKDIEIQVMFPGSVLVQGRDECRFTMSLNCENQPSIRRVTSGQSVSMSPRDQVHVECAKEALRTKIYDIATKVDPLRLALKLYSCKVIERYVVDKVKDPKQDAVYRNFDVLENVLDSLQNNPAHFSLLCEALDDVFPESKLNEEYKKNCHCTSVVHRSRQGSVSTTSVKSFTSAQERLSIEQDGDLAHDHQVNGFSDIEHPSLVAAFMNGAAIAPHDNVPLPFPIPTFGPNPQQSSSEEMAQIVFPVTEAADH